MGIRLLYNNNLRKLSNEYGDFSVMKNIYAKLFFQINCLYFLSFGRNFSVFKNQHLFEIRSKVKNHHKSEGGVSFEIQCGLRYGL